MVVNELAGRTLFCDDGCPIARLLSCLSYFQRTRRLSDLTFGSL
jgi:hypothetical protein